MNDYQRMLKDLVDLNYQGIQDIPEYDRRELAGAYLRTLSGADRLEAFLECSSGHFGIEELIQTLTGFMLKGNRELLERGLESYLETLTDYCTTAMKRDFEGTLLVLAAQGRTETEISERKSRLEVVK